MAHDPCDCHGQRFFGRSAYAYPAVIHDGNRSGERRRLCPSGSRDVLAYAEKVLHTTNMEQWKGDDWGRACDVCGVDLGEQQAGFVYLTMFPARDLRRDWHGLACGGCLADVRHNLLVAA